MEHPLVRAMRNHDISAATLAAELGVTRAAVAQWTNPGRVVPAEHCPKIERFFGGEVRCEELNDRIDWGYLRAHGERDPAQQEEGA
jgi:DNA-binding transcriptional regulator YdaS (Cro superfamily)